jgi:hypothetical protein
LSYQYRILRDIPLAAFPMNPGETGGFVDVSGNAVTSTIYGTITEAPPLVAGAGTARVLSDANGFRFTTSVFTDVYRDFTVEAWFKPTAAGTIQIVGHNHNNDGITWDGDAIRFTTKHTGGDCVATYYPPDFNDAFYVVGVHTSSKNQLWVNGVLRAETEVTAAQLLAGYNQPTSELFVGQAISGTPTAIVDAVAVYRTALGQSQITDHYTWGRSVRDFRDIVGGNMGTYWSFIDGDARVNFKQVFSDAATWSTGNIIGMDFQVGNLAPVFDVNGLTVAGSWSIAYILDSIDATIDGSRIEWDGDGTFTVQSSLDNGTTWTNCVNGKEIPGISSGFTTANKNLIIQILIPSGQPLSTITNIRSLMLLTYSSRIVRPNKADRIATLFGNVSMTSDLNQPIERFDKMGIELYNGYAVLGKDTDDTPEPTRTVELWVKLNTTPTATVTLIDQRDNTGSTSNWVSIGTNRTVSVTGGGAAYINGLPSNTTPLNLNQWTHVMLVLPADSFTNTVIGADVTGASIAGVTVGMAAIYGTALTAAQVLDFYNAYIGAPKTVIRDGAILKVQDDAPAAKVYAYVWSNSAG